MWSSFARRVSSTLSSDVWRRTATPTSTPRCCTSSGVAAFSAAERCLMGQKFGLWNTPAARWHASEGQFHGWNRVISSPSVGPLVLRRLHWWWTGFCPENRTLPLGHHHYWRHRSHSDRRRQSCFIKEQNNTRQYPEPTWRKGARCGTAPFLQTWTRILFTGSIGIAGTSGLWLLFW